MTYKKRTIITLCGLLTLSLLGNCWQFFSSLNSQSNSPNFVRESDDTQLDSARASLAQSAMVWLQRGQFEQAIDAMERLRKVSPAQAAELQINWLQALYTQLENEEFDYVQSALDVLLEAYAGYPGIEDYLLLQADLYERSDQPRLASDTFYQIGELPQLLDDEHIIADARRLALAGIEQTHQQQDWEQALEYLDGLLWRDPGYPPFILALVKTHIGLGDMPQAQLHLNRVAAEIEYSAEFNELTKRISLNQQPSSSQLALTVRNSHFLVPLSLSSNDNIELMIDTGASLSVISEDLIRQLPDTQFLRSATMNTAGGRVQSDVYRISSVQLGPYQINDVEFAVLPLENLTGDGLLGMNILEKFRFSVDTEAQVLDLNLKTAAP